MHRGRHHDPTLIQVLCLYLVLLAFFVVLFNLSQAENTKARAVADSLTTTFASDGNVGTHRGKFISIDGDIVARPDLQRDLGRLIKTEIPITEVLVIRPGRILQARIPSAQLFQNGGVLLRDDREALIRRIADSLVRTPPGLRYDLEILVGADRYSGDEGAPVEAAAAVLRAGRLAAALQDAGAPLGTIASGVERGDARYIRLVFHARSRREEKLDFAGENVVPAP